MFKRAWEWLNEPQIVANIRLAGDHLRWGVAAAALVVAAFTDFQQVLPVILSVGVAQLISECLKKIMNWTPFGQRPDGADDGFPSGHVAGAFSGAWYFFFTFGLEVAIIPLLLGVFTALSRWLPRKHSLLQVTVSAVLTFFVSQYYLT